MPEKTSMRRAFGVLPVLLSSVLRSSATIWEALATEGLLRPLSRGERTTLPAASAHLSRKVSGTQTIVARALQLSASPCTTQNRTTESGTRTARLAEVRPPDFPLTDYHSDFSNSPRAAESRIWLTLKLRADAVERIGDRVGRMTRNELGDSLRVELAARQLQPLGQALCLLEHWIWDGYGRLHTQRMTHEGIQAQAAFLPRPQRLGSLRGESPEGLSRPARARSRSLRAKGKRRESARHHPHHALPIELEAAGVHNRAAP